MNLTILTDGNNKYGFGHISRSQTLANFLVDNGYKVKVIVLSTVNLEVFSTNDNVIIEGERIDLNWVENLVIGAKKCLDLDTVPEAGEFCEYCAYAHSVSKF